MTRYLMSPNSLNIWRRGASLLPYRLRYASTLQVCYHVSTVSHGSLAMLGTGSRLVGNPAAEWQQQSTAMAASLASSHNESSHRARDFA